MKIHLGNGQAAHEAQAKQAQKQYELERLWRYRSMILQTAAQLFAGGNRGTLPDCVALARQLVDGVWANVSSAPEGFQL